MKSKHLSYRKLLQRSLSLLYLLITSQAFTQRTALQLRTEKLRIASNISIRDIQDARPDSEIIGSVFLRNEKKNLSLKDGTIPQLKKLIGQAIPSPSASTLLSVTLLELEISEKKLANGTISGQAILSVAFKRIGKTDTVWLVDNTFKTTFTRSQSSIPVSKYESILSSLFVKSFLFIDKWLQLNYPTNEALIKGVKIVFIPENIHNLGDTIHYNSRKIRWDDFLGKPTPSSSYAASIFTNFGYDSHFDVKDSYLIAAIQTKTYMLQGMSWVRPNVQDTYALAHEQLHFDITYLVVQRFKKKIAQMVANNIDDLNSMMQLTYLESYREMNQLQKQYDQETLHSLNKLMQAAWEQKVAQWLAASNE